MISWAARAQVPKAIAVAVSADQGVDPDVQRLYTAMSGEDRREGYAQTPDAAGVGRAVKLLGPVKQERQRQVRPDGGSGEPAYVLGLPAEAS